MTAGGHPSDVPPPGAAADEYADWVERLTGMPVAPAGTRENPLVAWLKRLAVVAVASAAASLPSAIVLAITDESGGGTDRPCIEVIEEYEDFLDGDRARLEILTAPGDDGESALESDEQARDCGIGDEQLRRLLDNAEAESDTPGATGSD